MDDETEREGLMRITTMWAEPGTKRLFARELESPFPRVPISGESIILSESPQMFIGVVDNVLWRLDGRVEVTLLPFHPGDPQGPSSIRQLQEWGFEDVSDEYVARGGTL